MDRSRQQPEQWLPEQFPQAEIRLDPARRGQKIGGTFAWDGFAGLEPIDRQGLLWRALRARFDRDDQLGIPPIITLTPAEYAVYCEPQMV